MTICKIKRLLPLTILLFGQCTREFEMGEREFDFGNYDEAKSHYELVEREDANYENAQSRINSIDSIFEKQTFDRAVNLFNEKMYSDAEVFFFKVDSASYLYIKSRTFLNMIDSIRQARRYQKEQEDVKSLKRLKQKVEVLYKELIAFKDKRDFHNYGFRAGYKYNRWLTDVKSLENSLEAKLLLRDGFVVGDLEMLGLEYIGSKGAETEYSRWAKKTISGGLKK